MVHGTSRTTGLALAGAMMVAFAGATQFVASAHAQSTSPAEKSPLQRTKTKLKPPPEKPKSTAPKGPKPLSGLKPVGRKLPLPSAHPVKREKEERVLPAEARTIRQAMRNAGEDFELPIGDSTATISPRFAVRGQAALKDGRRRVLEAYQDGEMPESGEELRDLITGDGRAVESVRGDYLGRGFREVRLTERESVFVKSDDPAATDDIVNMMEDRASESMLERWLDERERRCGSRRGWVFNPAGRAGGPPVLDAFILRATIRPVPEPTAAELARHEMTDAELAVYELEQGNIAGAMDKLGSYASANPEDAAMKRLHGVALLQGGRLEDAVAAIAEAYRLDPDLASSPVAVEYFAEQQRTLVELVQRVVPAAHRSASYDASLVAAVLMQSQGRLKEAQRMLQRAKAKGMPDSIERAFEMAGSSPSK